MRLVRFEDGQLEIALEPTRREDLVHDLSRKLTPGPAGAGWSWSRRSRRADVRAAGGARSARSSSAACSADPLVQAVLRTLPRREDRRRDADRGGQRCRTRRTMPPTSTEDED